MELLLWRWSATVQLTSLAIIALFFALLTRSVRLGALRIWVLAWYANFIALSITVLYWYFQPVALAPLARGGYMGAKTAFVILLIQGAWALKRPAAQLLARNTLVAALASYTLFCIFFVEAIERVGVIQHVVLSAGFLAGGCVLLRKPFDTGHAWLVVSFFVRAGLAAIETGAYVTQILSVEWITAAERAAVATFLAAHSSFDSGAEWLIALSCVLALSERTQKELLRNNAELLAAQEELRRLVDRDPLTALANRRALPSVFRAAQPHGAIVLFFDLDGFKRINDRLGHQAGDEILARFAAALRECFRPDDAIVRYAGDEFLVVARGLTRDAALERAERVRKLLARDRQRPPMPITFSVGVSELTAGGDPKRALREADDAMYEAKTEKASGPSLTLH